MRAQVGVEYLMVLGFVTLALAFILLVAYFYINISQTIVRDNQIEIFANKIINAAEKVFYSGEPSRTTIGVYLPEGVKNITIDDKNLIIEYYTGKNIAKRVFTSKVSLEGTISTEWGNKNLVLTAESNKVRIS